MRHSTFILRKHRAGDKVYLPKDSRDNQYILAEIPLTDKLLETVVGEVDTSIKNLIKNFIKR